MVSIPRKKLPVDVYKVWVREVKASVNGLHLALCQGDGKVQVAPLNHSAFNDNLHCIIVVFPATLVGPNPKGVTIMCFPATTHNHIPTS